MIEEFFLVLVTKRSALLLRSNWQNFFHQLAGRHKKIFGTNPNPKKRKSESITNQKLHALS